MQEISFKDWRLMTSIVDTDVLKLEIEALDGSDIIETGYSGPGGGKGGDLYTLQFTTQRMEDAHKRGIRRTDLESRDAEADGEDSGAGWYGDEDEAIYLRGWEINALVDEEGMLNVQIERGENAEIFEVEPIESGALLSPRVVIRFAAEEADEDDEDEEEEEEELEDEGDDFEDLDEMDDYEDDYLDELEEETDQGYDDIYGADEERY